jgi:hypothetical protein
VVTLRQRRPKVDKRRAGRRTRFAGAMAAQVTRISQLEEWQDERFAELDAEVEIHGRQRRGLVRRRRETIRRVPSLSRAWASGGFVRLPSMITPGSRLLRRAKSYRAMPDHVWSSRVELTRW